MTAGSSILRSISWPGKNRQNRRLKHGTSGEEETNGINLEGKLRKLSGKFQSSDIVHSRLHLVFFC